MPDHQWRRIVVQDVVISDRPSVEPGRVRTIRKPGGQDDEVFGCKVCGVEMGSLILTGDPCPGEAVDSLLARWGEDLASLMVMPEE